MSTCPTTSIEDADVLGSIRYYLSERFRLRFEDAGLEDMMDEAAEGAVEHVGANTEVIKKLLEEDENMAEDEGVDVSSFPNDDAAIVDIINSNGGAVRTLDGEIAGDEFARDAINYQILLNKIDRLLDRLKLDA